MIVRIIFKIFLLYQLVSCKEKAGQLSKVNINKGVKEDKDTIHLVAGLNRHFRKHNVEGSVIIYYNATGTYTTNNPTDVTRQTFPPSTFKIINLLIALETGVIKNENEIIKWTGEIPDKKLYSY